jgi:hypothetical protein
MRYFVSAAKKKSLSVKIQGDSHSFDIAESEYDTKILHHPLILREEVLYSKSKV